ncbi:Acyl-CoA-binding domain-containing protein 5 [Apophysomyces ossiformis]|uniref:Acyl-CoA-binding domain-containing protein 5 n=1 Tax=Apophysomyces ossiformis TaxID=679940 RepID=A0A8H7BXM3_9FUNG|nr:Acyl-CoA-binding domain-containing protein 5 [Apophysomyces ossiformis]
MKNLSFLLLTLSVAFSSVHAYLNVPNLMATLPFKAGMAAAQRNNSLILFGGENVALRFSNDLYQLTQAGDQFQWKILPQQQTPAGVTYGQAVVSGDNFYVMGGLAQNTANQLLPLQIYQYSFTNANWVAWPLNNNTNATNVPVNRQLFTATAYNGGKNVYICGGALNVSIPFAELWSLDLTTQTFTKLAQPPSARYGHTASLLSDGRLVVIGGVMVVPNARGLAPTTSVDIYDPKTNQWTTQKVSPASNGRYASTCTNHNAVITSDNKILIFGGDNGQIERTRSYWNGIAVLDTNTWTWNLPNANGIPPSSRSYASAGMLYGNYLTVAFGAALNTYYNDINVLNLDTFSWLQSFNTPNQGSSISAGLIAGVTIAAVVLAAIILFLLWRFWSYVCWLVKRIHSDIWKPRSGEPVWAETTRIVFQVVLLFLFTMFLVFVIKQSVTSPNITQRIVNPSATVEVPDIRFCFDGYPTYPNPADPRNPGVGCQTNNGYSCSNYIQPLNKSIFVPTFTDNLGEVNCYLFRSPEYFKMTGTSGANNGSSMTFTFYADQSINYGRVHMSLFPKEMDPNVQIYGIQDSIPSLMTEGQVLNWQNGERNDIQTTNVFDISPFTYSALSYELVDHLYLQDAGWNYVGFLPIQNRTPEMTSYFRAEAPNPAYTQVHTSIASVAVIPKQFAQLIDREVKMFTLLNALGFVGGVFGIVVALQAWLFGFRPRSPWGVVQRWSVGDMKRSLLRGLQSQFQITKAGIPLVHPVSKRFSTDPHNISLESEVDRIACVEERMQVLELLFKAYYVDDEVFRSLDNATKKTNQNQFPPSQEKQGDPENGFSHMFNDRRHSSGDSSQYPLQPQQAGGMNHM